MIQKKYCFTAVEALPAILRELRETEACRRARSVLIKVFTGKFAGKDIQRIHEIVEKELPKAQTVCVSQTVHPGSENEFGDVERYIAVNACFFSEASIKLLEYDAADFDHVEAVRRFHAQIAAQKDLKAVEVLCSGASKYLSHFIDLLSKGHEEIPFFGAEAGIASEEEFALIVASVKQGTPYSDVRQYVSAGAYHVCGAVLILYAGESLNVKVDYILGWNPLGKEMRATSLHGNNSVGMLDDMPAGEVYKKYLNVDMDECFLFNISEFPLLVRRNDCLLARVPMTFDEEKRLYFSGDIRRDDLIQLSYGNAQEMLENTWQTSEDMRRFQPEGIFLIMCGGRNIFMKEDAKHEREYYQRLQPNTMVCYAASEIYRYQERGGLLNKALIAVGMREGENASRETIAQETAPRLRQKMIPLHARLANFIQTTTDELKEMAETAKAANVAKSQFLSNMSHEIRTPINAILGMDEMILREFDDPTLMEYAGNIRNAGNSLLGLVNDILDFSKIEAGKMEIIPVDYEISSLLNDLWTMLRPRAENKGLEFLVEADSAIPHLLHGDEIRLKQIITNLLTNAVKYTEKGSVTLKVSIARQESDKIDLDISVRDTGIGIKQEDIEKLFTAFERIEEKRNRHIEGTGLGMSITHRLLELMQSELRVESEYGKGSVFSFTVRQKIADGEPMGDFAEACRRSIAKSWTYREKFTAPEAQVLVIDDTELNLKVFQGLLKQTKVQIDTADDGPSCLAMTKEKKYDILFLDHRMPGMDGIETLERLKAMEGNPNTEVPVVALTANAVSGARESYIAAGFTDYLTKPIDSNQLENMLLRYLPKEKIQPGGDGGEKRSATQKKEEMLPAWLLKLSNIDHAEGIRNCGSAETYLDTLRVFAEGMAENADEIDGYFRQEDWINYTTKVHALKSTARIIGAKELSERAKRLEHAGNAGDIASIKADTPALLQLYRSYGEAFAPFCPKDAASDLPMISSEDLQEAYETLREVAVSFDYESLMFVMESLAGYTLPESEAERYEELKSAAKKPDWEKIRELLRSESL